MKKNLALLWLLTMCSALPLAATTYINAGEYKSDISLRNSDNLIVNGGGTNVVDAWDSSSVEIYSTSLPLSLEGKRGVYDIFLNDSSTLSFSGGATQSLKIGNNASALLTGGTINYLTIYHYGSMTCSATIKCQEGWQWLYTSSKITGIMGLWGDGASFQITLSNPTSSLFPETWKFVNVEIVPEPASMLLLGLGGLLFRRKK